jgi:hypothetical protein
MRDAGVDQEVRMREVRHSDSSVNDRYTHVLEEAHLAAAEQVAAAARKAANGHERHGFPRLIPSEGGVLPANRVNTNFSADKGQWGGWGSNPRPADYEKHGPTLRAR